MTTFALLVAALHAVPVVIAARWWPTRTGVIVASGAMAAAAIAYGWTEYVWLDLAGVALGAFTAFGTLPRRTPAHPRDAESTRRLVLVRPGRRTSAARATGAFTFVLAVAAAAVAMRHVGDGSDSGADQSERLSRDADPSSPRGLLARDSHVVGSPALAPGHLPSRERDLRHCLRMEGNDFIARCANGN